MSELLTIFNSDRFFGYISPNIVISENHSDRTEITQHPIEFGAKVSDHEIIMQAQIVIEMMFDAGGSIVDFYDTSDIGITIGKSAKEIYQDILDMRYSLEPFDVSTGKRLYNNMRIASIDVTTDSDTENILSITIGFSEVLIASINKAELVPVEKQKFGNLTDGVTNTGIKQAGVIDNNNTILRDIAEGI